MKQHSAIEKEIGRRHREHNGHENGRYDTLCAKCGKSIDWPKGWVLMERRSSSHVGDKRTWYHPGCDK